MLAVSAYMGSRGSRVQPWKEVKREEKDLWTKALLRGKLEFLNRKVLFLAISFRKREFICVLLK